jgi:hypothetical protein
MFLYGPVQLPLHEKHYCRKLIRGGQNRLTEAGKPTASIKREKLSMKSIMSSNKQAIPIKDRSTKK